MSAIDPSATDAASATDTGQTRSNNQDACGEFSDADGARLFVVADGMGGHAGGAVASRLAVETIGKVFRTSSEGPEGTLRAAFESANERIFERAQESEDLAGMGTTGVALLVGEGEHLWLAHVGDSRAYRFRDGRLERLTTDHSLVEAMQQRGLITAEEAAVHPERNVILRSLGVQSSVEVDVTPIASEPGDRYLLCSDGLSSVVPEPEIAAVLARNRPAAAASLLVDMANQRGGPDNVTVQVIQIPGGTREEAIAPRVRAGAASAGRRLARMRRVALAAGLVGVLLLALVLWMVATH